MPKQECISVALEALTRRNPMRALPPLSYETYAAEAFSLAALHAQGRLSAKSSAAVFRFWNPYLQPALEEIADLTDEIHHKLDEILGVTRPRRGSASRKIAKKSTKKTTKAPAKRTTKKTVKKVAKKAPDPTKPAGKGSARKATQAKKTPARRAAGTKPATKKAATKKAATKKAATKKAATKRTPTTRAKKTTPRGRGTRTK